jgi:hypothetical protein
VNVRAESDEIMGQIVETRSLLVNGGLKYTNSIIWTKMKKIVNLGATN